VILEDSLKILRENLFTVKDINSEKCFILLQKGISHSDKLKKKLRKEQDRLPKVFDINRADVAPS